MMDPVHVGRDKEPPKIAIEPDRNGNIPVIEHRGWVEQDLEDEHAERGSPSATTTANLISIESTISIG
jgi:hypothetical protein